MSLKAVNWAMSQKGLKPTAKLVLLQLADRHHPAHGCFPSQSRLAEDCEVSLSSLQRHLKALEGAGVIRRVKRPDVSAFPRRATLYQLGFEFEEGASQ